MTQTTTSDGSDMTSGVAAKTKTMWQKIITAVMRHTAVFAAKQPGTVRRSSRCWLMPTWPRAFPIVGTIIATALTIETLTKRRSQELPIKLINNFCTLLVLNTKLKCIYPLEFSKIQLRH